MRQGSQVSVMYNRETDLSFFWQQVSITDTARHKTERKVILMGHELEEKHVEGGGQGGREDKGLGKMNRIEIVTHASGHVVHPFGVALVQHQACVHGGDGGQFCFSHI